MKLDDLIKNIRLKKSFLCVGLDPDLDLLPSHLLKEDDPVFMFNKLIIDATQDLCVAYKPNLAFYEKLGSSGLISLKKTIDYISDNHLVIADAKRSDIFNSAKKYADTFYDYFNCDAVTVSPYMGADAVKPFLRKNKWAILLIATSNDSAFEIQNIVTDNGHPLYLDIVHKSFNWSSPSNTMFVVGATRPLELSLIRKSAPHHFFLVPGIGAQGGDLETVCKHAFNESCGLLINMSRSILYANKSKIFYDYSRQVCLDIQKKMELVLIERNFIN